MLNNNETTIITKETVHFKADGDNLFNNFFAGAGRLILLHFDGMCVKW